MIELSLVTGAYNRPLPLYRLVNSVINNTKVSWELIISDASDQITTFEHSSVRVLVERPRLGHSRGYNQAFRNAQGEFLLWLNDDAEVCEGYDTIAIDFMKAHPQIGLGALYYSENGGPFHVNSAWRMLYANFGIFRKTLGEQVGYFDEDIWMYGADNSLAFRVLLADYGIADIPGTRILHHSRPDSIRRDNQKPRKSDNDTLKRKYVQYRRKMQMTYERYKVNTGVVPWEHGVPV